MSREECVMFNGENYEEWSAQMLNNVRSKKLGKHVVKDGRTKFKGKEEVWEDEDEEACGKIALKLAPKYQAAIMKYSTAIEIWDHIRTIGEMNAMNRTLYDRRMFSSAYMEENGDLESHLMLLESCQRRLVS